ncbi:MAG TPA: hypothetical protein VG388_12120 [Solirubrobacteraceae bacterium]|nr:hypothetical protein [Solirubrobacteraceae bacterium]
MGLLDDAIREHLDLKRRRGADPTEVEREEREVLGPVRRRGEPVLDDPLAQHDDELEHEPLPMDDGEWDEPASGSRRAVAFDYEELEVQEPYGLESDPYAAPERDLGGGEAYGASRGGDPEPYGAQEGEPKPYGGSEREPEPYGASRHEPDAYPPPEPRPFAAEAGREPDPYAAPVREPDPNRASAHERDPYAPPEQRPFAAGTGPERPGLDEETAEFSVEDVHVAENDPHHPEGTEEDVLEETPDFLQDTPDHDRLWFEQRPPRDFDFDG